MTSQSPQTSPHLTLVDTPAPDLVETLVQRSQRQAQLFNAGEMDRWHEHARFAEDFTLMQPFGGPVSHGFDASPERLAALSRTFRNGDARLEIAKTYASDDMVVLVYIERQTLEVNDLPSQDWSLRVTQVFRRQADGWTLVHRHADPLVHPLTLEAAAALAKGA